MSNYGTAWYGPARYDEVRCGEAGHGVLWTGKLGVGSSRAQVRKGPVWWGLAHPGLV